MRLCVRRCGGGTEPSAEAASTVDSCGCLVTGPSGMPPVKFAATPGGLGGAPPPARVLSWSLIPVTSGSNLTPIETRHQSPHCPHSTLGDHQIGRPTSFCAVDTPLHAYPSFAETLGYPTPTPAMSPEGFEIVELPGFPLPQIAPARAGSDSLFRAVKSEILARLDYYRNHSGFEPANNTVSLAPHSVTSTSTINPRWMLSSCGWMSCTSPSSTAFTAPTFLHHTRPHAQP